MQITVIGVGQLGSRHLQSLAGLAGQHTLHAVEPATAGLELARERLGATSGQVHFHRSTESLPEAIDVAIVATGAAARREVVTALLNHSRVRCLLLEKIVFQSVTDCLWARDFLATHQVKTWVNFPRRVQPVYEVIRETITAGQPVDIHVTGARWGLATSAVHFLDLVLFLSGSAKLTIDEFQVETYPSRHAGCLEGFGLITGGAGLLQSYSIRAWADGHDPVQVTVESAGQRWIVNEGDQQTRAQHFSAAKNWQPETITHPFYYQSQLTGPVVESLLSTGTCKLADYAAALQSHIPFLRAWNRLLAPDSDPDSTRCPIT